jgi:hypothetical protein
MKKKAAAKAAPAKGAEGEAMAVKHLPPKMKPKKKK